MRVSHFHSILDLSDKRTLGDECEEASLQFVGKWYNEANKDDHLCHQKEEDL